MKSLFVAAFVGWFCSIGLAQAMSPLFARGYTVIPEPQKVSLGTHDFKFGQNWQLKLDTSVAHGDVAVEALQAGLHARFQVQLGTAAGPDGVLLLRIAPGSVSVGRAQDPNRSKLAEQAYRITLHNKAITITANAGTGLFYGVETFLQLLHPNSGTLWLPEGTIEDWPDLELRLIFWDDSYHLDRVDALKRDIRQAAFYKINGFVLKLNGHFQYKSAPAVVEPYALTATELRELASYGRHFHVHLIPYLDGPGQVSFILKHPEYAKLREFPNNNYEICATNTASYGLLQDMSRELIYATEGADYFLGTAPASDYFFLSTDDPYFLGMAHNSQCNEANLKRQLGSAGQVFVHFVDETGNFLRDHHRIVLFRGMDPLGPQDIASLPYYAINGFIRDSDYNAAYHSRKIPQILNAYVGGKKYLFPGYYTLPEDRRLHKGETRRLPDTSTIAAAMKRISSNPARSYPNVIGEIGAGWGDEGANPESFWMGYIASDAAGWHPGSPNTKEWEDTFYSLFYGDRAVDMGQVYRLMSEQAQAWDDSWDWVPSKARKPIWGGYQQIYDPPRPAMDQTIPLPPTPDANLAYASSWSDENAKRVALAVQAKQANDTLLKLLHENIQRVQFNRYNLEVYGTIANLYRQNWEMICEIHNMDTELASASRIRGRDPKAALDAVDRALDIAETIRRQRNEVLRHAVATWDKEWFPRVRDANGRHFFHELDDVMDPLADRTVDMSYLVYREKLLPFGTWVDSVLASRNEYAISHRLPVRQYRLSWDSFNTGSPGSAAPTDGK